jgi:UDP-glucuronate 4-epimerase
MKILVTGVAGFIGMHVAESLIKRGDEVYGIDSLNDYYSVKLKNDRLNILLKNHNFKFRNINIDDFNSLKSIFNEFNPAMVIHLAAQAGVRYSMINPFSYFNSNLVGFGNILECCKLNEIKHLVFASSSSVYGLNSKIPFSVQDSVDHPVSLYAATKRSNELMAHSYSHIYNMSVTGLRFFTVYGPWGRPDMSPWLFTDAILNNKKIELFNNGIMMRDFTYIDDIVDGVILALDNVATSYTDFNKFKPEPHKSSAPFKIYNLGNNKPVKLKSFLSVLEKAIGVEAIIEYMPMQAGDVYETLADISISELELNFKPKIDIETGINRWVKWFKNYKHN